MRSVKTRELILFTKQFSTMLGAGIPVLRLLEVLVDQTENPRLKSVIRDIIERIRRGESLHQSFGAHPKVFPKVYVSMVNAGEASGSLPEVLERLTRILQHEDKVRSDVKAACRYPIVVVCMLALAFFILLTFVIPRFAAIFEKGGVRLPFPTRVCIELHGFLQRFWLPLGAVLLLAVVGFLFALRTTRGRYLWDAMLLKLPVLGPLFIKSAMSRFASIFAILQASGVSALDALGILRDTIGNEAISREFQQISQELVEGRGISGPLRAAKYFPPMVVNMTAIGEEAGALDELLREVADHYDVEVQYATQGLSDALTPILVVGLTVIVGFFAFAVFLPMWDMYKIVQQ
jgi:type IV pilus assembly protein PilC